MHLCFRWEDNMQCGANYSYAPVFDDRRRMRHAGTACGQQALAHLEYEPEQSSIHHVRDRADVENQTRPSPMLIMKGAPQRGQTTPE